MDREGLQYAVLKSAVDRASKSVASDSDPDSPAGGLLGPAGAIAVAALLSRVLGLVREQVFAVLFGAGDAMDAFNVAFRIPNVLRNLFAEGAMSASLVPVFTRVRVEEGEERGWRLAGLAFRTLGALSGILALMGMAMAPGLVGLLAGPFHEVPGKFELTVTLTRTLFPYFPWVVFSAALMAILNCRGRFFLPALSSAVFNGVAIVTGVAGVVLIERLHRHGGSWGPPPIEGMALGMLFGGVAQAGIQLPLLYREGYRWRGQSRSSVAGQGLGPHPAVEPGCQTWYRDRGLQQVLAVLLPGTLGLAATQISGVVNTILAATQGVGAVSWLSYAFRLVQFPIGIFGASLASATLIRLSRESAEKRGEAVNQTLTVGLKHCFAMNLPAAAGLAFLARPIVELIFQYGRFQPHDTEATALALSMYVLGLPAYSMVKILAPACYALGAARLPWRCGAASVLLTLALNLALIRPLGYWSLALGTSLGAILNGLTLLWFLDRRLASEGHGLDLRGLGRSFFAYLAVSLLMGISVAATNERIPSQFSACIGWMPLTRLLRVTLLLAEGALLTGILARIFGCDEVAGIQNLFVSVFKKKLSRDLF